MGQRNCSISAWFSSLEKRFERNGFENLYLISTGLKFNSTLTDSCFHSSVRGVSFSVSGIGGWSTPKTYQGFCGKLLKGKILQVLFSTSKLIGHTEQKSLLHKKTSILFKFPDQYIFLPNTSKNLCAKNCVIVAINKRFEILWRYNKFRFQRELTILFIRKMCLISYANNKGADEPEHPRSLISAFVFRCLDSIISLDSIAEISRL